MLATLSDEAFDQPDWLFEIKWDGYRAVAYVEMEKVALQSRNLLSFSEKFFPITQALQKAHLHAVLDGEIVAVGENGVSVFQSLQNWQNTPVHLRYYVFDILWMDGYDLTQLPLLARKKILKEILPKDDEVLKYSDHIMDKGKDFYEAALAQGLEGIMGKKSTGVYQPGFRTKEWLKIKVNKREEVVIAGFTEPRNSRKYFGSLLLGLYEEKELVYVGHTGSGFTVKTLQEIYQQLQPLKTTVCPFKKKPKTNMPATWVAPKMVCEIKFTEWTKDRIARHPIFMGLRVDKNAKDVTLEKVQHMGSAKKKTIKKAPATKKATMIKSANPITANSTKRAVSSVTIKSSDSQPNGNKQHVAEPKEKKSSKKSNTKIASLPATDSLSLTGKNQELIVNGHQLQLTNLDKLYWKKEHFTKGDMIRYYVDIAPFMLPYMKDRPQSLNRHPNGIEGLNFYQKDVHGKVPDWMATHTDYSESTKQHVEYLVCSNEATLVYMANMGCIEMHPWHSRSKTWEKPDWCLIDLDPDKKNSFDQVIQVAMVVKQLLDSIGVDACCKTSGSSGIHIYIPLGAKYSYDQSKQLAELIVTLVNQELPDLTSLERSPSKRNGKLYLDYLQNRETQTAAAPYSLRPKPGVPVSTPLDWTEVKKGLTPTTYHARNIFERLKSEGDLFQPVLGKGIQLEKILSSLALQLK